MSLSVEFKHRFGDFDLDIAFEAPAGVTAIYGRSGSGKTTIANVVSGLLEPERGRVSVGGRVLIDTSQLICLPPHKRNIGYVFQDARLFPHLSVRGNLAYANRFNARSSTCEELKAMTALLGIEALMQRKPASLSGGERQRVAIGRALLSNPSLLLMDEPLASLDDARKAEILPYLEKLCARTQVPIIYISHSIAEIARLADTVVTIEDGRATGAGPADRILSDLELVRSVDIREAGSILTATVVAVHDDGLSELKTARGRIFVPDTDRKLGDRLRIRIPATEVILSRSKPKDLSALNILPARITAIRKGIGPGMMVRLDSGGDTLLARITARSAKALKLEPGGECFAVFKTVSVSREDVGTGEI
jgi:molybdate transport system ATP-binding protein